jgi:hypothetical protein
LLVVVKLFSGDGVWYLLILNKLIIRLRGWNFLYYWFHSTTSY